MQHTDNRRPVGISALAAENDYFSRQIPLATEYTTNVMEQIDRLKLPPSLASETSESSFRNITNSIDVKLFDARANAKILISQVSMHLRKGVREKLFKQLDMLHDVEDWDPDYKPVQKQSLLTFLRWFTAINPKQSPGLGLTHTGNLFSTWRSDGSKLNIESMSNDKVRWITAIKLGNDFEYTSGETKLSRLPVVLAPFHFNEFFFDLN